MLDFFYGKGNIWSGYILLAAAVVFLIVGIVAMKAISIVIAVILAIAGVLRIMLGRRFREKIGAAG